MEKKEKYDIEHDKRSSNSCLYLSPITYPTESPNSLHGLTPVYILWSPNGQDSSSPSPRQSSYFLHTRRNDLEQDRQQHPRYPSGSTTWGDTRSLWESRSERTSARSYHGTINPSLSTTMMMSSLHLPPSQITLTITLLNLLGECKKINCNEETLFMDFLNHINILPTKFEDTYFHQKPVPTYLKTNEATQYAVIFNGKRHFISEKLCIKDLGVTSNTKLHIMRTYTDTQSEWILHRNTT